LALRLGKHSLNGRSCKTVFRRLTLSPSLSPISYPE